MNPLRIAYSDLAKSLVLTVSSEAVGYPGSNAVHPHLSRVWRTTGIAAEWIKFDAGVGLTVNFDTAIIVGHNLTAAAVVKAQADPADAWAPATLERGGDPSLPIIFMDFAPLPAGNRYARFSIEDPTNSAGYISIGRVLLCVRYDAEEQIGAGFQLTTEDTTAVSRSLTGQVFADLGIQQRVYSMSMGTMKDTTKLALVAICQSAGLYDPVVVLPSDGIDPLYATFTKLPKFTEQGGWSWGDDSLVFREAL